VARFELTTSCSQSRRSTKLSYTPVPERGTTIFPELPAFKSKHAKWRAHRRSQLKFPPEAGSWPSLPCQTKPKRRARHSKNAVRWMTCNGCATRAPTSWPPRFSRSGPDAQFAYGPPIDHEVYGFYYDLDMRHRLTPDDFAAIEEEMRKIVKENQPFERIVVSRSEAMELAQSGRLGGLTQDQSRAGSKSICSTRSLTTRKSPSTRTAISGTFAPAPMSGAPATAKPTR